MDTQNNDQVGATQLGAKYGYQFTTDEFWQENQRRQSEFQQRQEAGELNEAGLEAVRGGYIGSGSTVNLMTTIMSSSLECKNNE